MNTKHDKKIVSRRVLRFTKPWDQLLIILPSLTSIVFLIVSSYSCMAHIRDLAVYVLQEQGIGDPVVNRYVSDTGFFLFVFWLTAVILLLVGFIWVGLMSYRIFGPFSRLERELIAVRDGIMDPAGLKVRQKDALYKIVELFRQILCRNK